MILVATPGDITANSYLTRAEATDILTTQRLHSDAWVAATTAQQDTALMWATRLIDQGFDWKGAVRSLTQRLRWPRVGMLDADYRYIDPDSIPTPLKLATADLALSLIARDRVSEPELLGQGFSSASVGPLSVTVDRQMVLTLIPGYILDTLRPWGEPIYSDVGGMRTVGLVRG